MEVSAEKLKLFFCKIMQKTEEEQYRQRELLNLLDVVQGYDFMSPYSVSVILEVAQLLGFTSIGSEMLTNFISTHRWGSEYLEGDCLYEYGGVKYRPNNFGDLFDVIVLAETNANPGTCTTCSDK